MEQFPASETPHEHLSESLIREKVNEIRKVHIEAAEKYLPESSPLRQQIELFYSDEERLNNEIGNVLRNKTEKEAEEWVEGFREGFETEGEFLNHVAEKDYSTSEHRDERFPEHPYT
jgi:hypothetical protein